MSSLTKIVLVSAAVLGLGALAATGVSWACGPICAAPAKASKAQADTAKQATRATATLEVSGMHCAACPITVRKALEAVPGVEKATVTFDPPRAVVLYDPARAMPEQLTKATADAGYPSRVMKKD
jgi:mercuric ion binding protein